MPILAEICVLYAITLMFCIMKKYNIREMGIHIFLISICYGAFKLLWGF